MAQRIFTGFSTVGAQKSRQRTFHDLELVKRDLTNHFYTRVGERVMRPDWGCMIWNLLMEPLTPGVRDQMENDVKRIVKAEPRCVLVGTNLIELPHGVRIEMTLDFRPLGVVDTLILNFERRESLRWDGGF